MTYQEYAALPGIRASELKSVLKCPQKYWWEKQHPKETEALAFGRALHAFVLDPEEFATGFLIVPKIDKRSAAGKAEYGALIATGKQLVTEEDYQKIKGMDASLRAHPEAGQMLREWETEQVRQWGGFKARADLVGPRCLADLKTAKDASPMGARRAMMNDLLHVQAAHYSEGWGIYKFKFIFVEKTEPYPVGVYPVGSDAMDEGEILRQRGVVALNNGEQTGIWPSYPSCTLHLWGHNDDEDEEGDE